MRSIINILQNNTALTTLIGGADKIGINIIGQTVKTPYVTVDAEERTPTNAFDQDAKLDYVRFTVHSVADLTFTSGSIVGADEIGNAVRNAINYVSPGTYDGETIARCTIQRGGQMQEDRISNKPQITREDDYLVLIRPNVFSNISTTTTKGNYTEYSVNITSLPIQVDTDNGIYTDYGVLLNILPIQTTTETGIFNDYGVLISDIPIIFATASSSNTDTIDLWLSGSGDTVIGWFNGGSTTNVSLTGTPTKYSYTFAGETPELTLTNQENIDSITANLTSNFTTTTSQINAFTSLTSFINIGAVVTGNVHTINSSITTLNLGDQTGNTSLTGDIGTLIFNNAFTSLNITGGDLTYSTQSYVNANIPNGMTLYLKDNGFSDSEVDQIPIDFALANTGSGNMSVLGSGNGNTTASSASAISDLETDSWTTAFNGIPITSASYSNTGQTFTEETTGTDMVLTTVPNPSSEFTIEELIDDLPPSWTVNSTTGTISPISDASTAGDYNIVVRVRAYGAYTGFVDVALTPTIEVAASPPVLTFNPLDSATDVAVDGVITITSDEAIRNTDGSEITNANVDSLITLKEDNDSGSNIAFDAVINAGKTVITITPDSDLPNSQAVYVEIASVENSNGDETTGGENATFTTIAAVVSEVINIALQDSVSVINTDDPFNKYWNNALLADLNGTLSNLVDEDNNATTKGLVLAGWNGANDNQGYNNVNDGFIPNSAHRHNHLMNVNGATAKLTGYDNAETYTVYVSGSRNTSAGTRIAEITIDGTMKVLDSEDNPPTNLSFTGVSPTAGEILITYDKQAGSNSFPATYIKTVKE